ncbi:hypothetical protein Hanom_Chr04g00320981 [Helianthus anomalus]
MMVSSFKLSSSIFSTSLSFVNIPIITLWIVCQLSASGRTMITADPIVPHAIATTAQKVKYPLLNSSAFTR